MSNRLLREYVSLMLEKIRTKKGVDSKFGNKFDLKKFKSLDNIQMMNAYADRFLEKMGQGSSRAAYLLSSKYVLKIAINEKGLAQDEAEVDVFTNPRSQPIVAKVYGADQKFQWLISDLVKPIKSPDEFKALSGVDWKTFSNQIYQALRRDTLDPDAADFTKSVIATAKNNKLLHGDMVDTRPQDQSVIDHWGKTPDGRVVLLDYGFTGEVWEKHYSTKPTAPQGKQPIGDNEKTVKPGAQQAKTQKGGTETKTAASPYAKTVPAAGQAKTAKQGR